MQPVLNVEDVKRVEVALTRVGVSISELMHRAGCAAAQEALALGDVQNAVILAGMGNNGGDGWVAAEALLAHGVNVKVVTPVEPDQLSGDLARQVAQRAVRAGVSTLVGPSRDELEGLLSASDVALDCMLGTGFHGDVRAPFDIWIDCVNSSGVRVVAVDVPSGLSAQTGHAPGACVVADLTVTMLCLKPGLLADDGRDVCGSIVVAPLAEQTEQIVVEADPVAWRTDLEDYLDVMVPPTTAVDKFSRGSVLVVGGSSRFVGAPILAARAAARAGAGYVTLAVPAYIVPQVQAHVLEIPVVGLPCDEDGTISKEAVPIVTKLAEKRSAVLAGPGMRVSGGTVAVVSALLASPAPLVLDADALNCIARLKGYNCFLPIAAATLSTAHTLKFAKGTATGCVGVEQAILPKPGPAALATAGSGDVLGGIIASKLAQTYGRLDNLPLLCALSCELHGYAATLAMERMGSRGVMASDIIDELGIADDALGERVTFPDADNGDDNN